MKKIVRNAKLAGLGICTFLSFSAKAQFADVTTISSVHFNHPWGVDLNASNGDVYVGEAWNSDLLKTTSAGTTSIVYNGINGDFGPAQVAYDGSTHVYVADAENSLIYKVSLAGVRTEIGAWDPINQDYGGPLNTNHPHGVDLDGSGNLYIADTDNHRIFKLSNGIITNLGGLSGTSGSSNGTSSRFNQPKGICVVGTDDVYIADYGNNAIRRISWTSGGYSATTFATGITGPTAITRDNNGYFYVTGNQAVYRITPAGVVNLLAGSPGNAGYSDGRGTNARFSSPCGIVSNASGTMLYVGGGLGSSLRKIVLSYPSGGTCTSYKDQGNWTNGMSPTTIINSNDPAEGFGNEWGEPSDDIVYSFNLTQGAKVIIKTCPPFPGGISDSYLYLLNSCSNVIASSDNHVSCSPHGYIEVDNLPTGRYYFIVEGKGTASGYIMTTYDTEPCSSCRTEEDEDEELLGKETIVAYPNPSTGVVHVKMNQRGGTLVVSDLMGKEVARETVNPTNSEYSLDLSNLQKGMYSLKIEGVKSGKLIQLQ